MTGSFELQLRQFAEKAKENADAAVRKVVLDVGSRLVLRSPVDTGRFRSNWYYGLGEANLTTTTETQKREVQNLSALPVKAVGSVHYITNNLPYAQRLEVGYSKQAPNGMVGLTTVEFQQIIDKAAADVAAGKGGAE